MMRIARINGNMRRSDRLVAEGEIVFASEGGELLRGKTESVSWCADEQVLLFLFHLNGMWAIDN